MIGCTHCITCEVSGRDDSNQMTRKFHKLKCELLSAMTDDKVAELKREMMGCTHCITCEVSGRESVSCRQSVSRADAQRAIEYDWKNRDWSQWKVCCKMGENLKTYYKNYRDDTMKRMKELATTDPVKKGDIDRAAKQLEVKLNKQHRVMEVLLAKFHEFRKNQERIRLDTISHQLLRFFTDDQDVKLKDDHGEPLVIRRTVSFSEILRIYPNANTIRFVNRHLDHTGYNTSRLNELVIRSLLNEIEGKRVDDEPKECPLRKVVFTYYDYEGDIFDANMELKEEKRNF